MYITPMQEHREELPFTAPTRQSALVPGRSKSASEKKEAVWPPQLEAALIAALEQYKPISTRGVEVFQRFPKRNHFIADYIYSKTGVRRTPRQVGSRLQQLRGTCSDIRILSLLTRRDFSNKLDNAIECHSETGWSEDNLESPSCSSLTYSPRPSSAVASAPPPPALADHPSILHDGGPSCSNTSVCIELVSLEANCRHAAAYPEIKLGYDRTSGVSTPKDHFRAQRHLKIIAPRPLWSFIPTVTFSCNKPISLTEHQSVFSVYLGQRFIHLESTPLNQIPMIMSPNSAISYVYGTQLIPLFWGTLCRNTGALLACTVIQDIMRKALSPTSDVGKSDDTIVCSFSYTFKLSGDYHGSSATILETCPIPSNKREPQLPPFFSNESFSGVDTLHSESQPQPFYSGANYFDTSILPYIPDMLQTTGLATSHSMPQDTHIMDALWDELHVASPQVPSIDNFAVFNL